MRLRQALLRCIGIPLGLRRVRNERDTVSNLGMPGVLCGLMAALLMDADLSGPRREAAQKNVPAGCLATLIQRMLRLGSDGAWRLVSLAGLL